ncbi:MFS transporter [Bacillus altitudinis]|uniref:MFS transporter n=1 Tax=Bacillus altitudinis TaxID=293387 RepID=UPI0020C3E614|nr:MFS transporter [Bacillus altitudinis]MCY7530278.1 MFS transporter [Bacillus altitudinis]
MTIKSRLIVIAISLGVFASSMSTTMLFIAYPELVQFYNIDYEVVQWRNIVFWSFFGVFMPFFGIMAKMTNVKKMFLIGLSLFTISCLLSAFSSSWGMFLVGQSFQGLADAMIVPVQAVLIRSIFSEDKIGWAFGLQGSVMAASALLGPSLGGLIIQSMKWQMIFLLLGLIGLIALALGLMLVPNIEKSTKFIFGNLPIVGTLSLLLTFISIQAIFISESDIWILFGFTGLASFLYVEFFNKVQTKIIPPDLWSNRPFLINALRGFFIFLSINAIATFTPIYFRMSQGYEASVVGMVLLASPIVMISLGAWGGRRVDKSLNKTMIFGLTLLSIYSIGCILPGENSFHYVYFILVFIIGGIGAVMVLPAQNKVALTSSPKTETGTYMGLFQMVQFTTASVAGVLFAPIIQSTTNTEISVSGYQMIGVTSTVFFLCSILIVIIEAKINRRKIVDSNGEIQLNNKE